MTFASIPESVTELPHIQEHDPHHDPPHLRPLESEGTRSGQRRAALAREVAELLAQGFIYTTFVALVLLIITVTWKRYLIFGQFGFDTGIFTQGTWLLSQRENAFVTIRGLHLFGDHASYILALVAPLYHVLPDPRTLLALQVVGATTPGLILFEFMRRRASIGIATVFALLYFLYPTMLWAASWSFHPETFAATFLTIAIVALVTRRWKTLVVALVLALLCKEDVSVVVFGLGIVAAVRGHRRVGLGICVAALGYFALVTSVFMPAINGRGSPHFALNYGITENEHLGPLSVVSSVPMLLGRFIDTVTSDVGLAFVMLLLAPVGFLALRDPKWLIPVIGPVVLNLSSTAAYQHTINYQYLVTSAPFVVAGAFFGFQRLRATALHPNRIVATLPIVVLVAFTTTMTRGPVTDFRNDLNANVATTRPMNNYLSSLPKDLAISATYNYVTTLSSRTSIYEFPNPYVAANWGFIGDTHEPADTPHMDMVIVDTSTLNAQGKSVLHKLRSSGEFSETTRGQHTVVLTRLNR